VGGRKTEDTTVTILAMRVDERRVLDLSNELGEVALAKLEKFIEVGMITSWRS